jgi:hypothetical protein
MDASGHIHALVWNPSSTSQTLIFNGPNNTRVQRTVPAQSLSSVKLN